jgi:hypothetical protein
MARIQQAMRIQQTMLGMRTERIQRRADARRMLIRRTMHDRQTMLIRQTMHDL